MEVYGVNLRLHAVGNASFTSFFFVILHLIGWFGVRGERGEEGCRTVEREAFRVLGLLEC